MPLLLTPASAEADYLNPHDDDCGPLRNVLFPRLRRSWKRDREAVRIAMQGAINKRCCENVDEHGFTKDHSLRFATLNHARYEISRHFFLDHRLMNLAYHDETIARLRRYVLAARKYAKPSIPTTPSPTPHTGGRE